MHNPQDETYVLDSNYLTRYHACSRILQAHGISIELSNLRTVFPLICKEAKDGLDADALKALYQEALRNLLTYIGNYNKPILYQKLSKEELERAFMDECYLDKPNPAKLRQMLDLGVDMYVKDSNDPIFPYIRAMHSNDMELLQLFLERGANVNYTYGYKADYYDTFWLRNIMNAPLARVQLMIRYGAKVLDKDGNGNNVLHIISESRVDIDVVKLFVQLGVDVNATNKDGETPLFVMSRNELNAKSCIFLVKSGAHPNIANTAGSALVHRIAAWFQDEHNSIMSLVQLGMDVNKQDGAGQTALHIASQRNNATIAQALLGVGANANIANNKGQRPYDIAIAQGYLKVAQLFNENAGEDYTNRPEYAQIEGYKRQIIAALKAGKRWSRFDKEGWQEFYYNSGTGKYTVESGEHQSDYRSSYDYDEKGALEFLYSNVSYWDKQGKTEVEIWAAVAGRL